MIQYASSIYGYKKKGVSTQQALLSLKTFGKLSYNLGHILRLFDVRWNFLVAKSETNRD